MPPPLLIDGLDYAVGPVIASCKPQLQTTGMEDGRAHVPGAEGPKHRRFSDSFSK
jgi:hypothetical protein